jgi:hypothetical protein
MEPGMTSRELMIQTVQNAGQSIVHGGPFDKRGTFSLL